MNYFNVFYKKNHSLIWTLIILIAFNVYSIVTYGPISINDLVFIEGRLDGKVEIAETGGDMPFEFLEFKLKGLNKQFIVSSGAYYAINVEEMLKLKDNQLLKIYVEKTHEKQQKVYQVELSEPKVIMLDLDSYNKGEDRAWISLLPIEILLGILLVYELKKKITTSQNDNIRC